MDPRKVVDSSHVSGSDLKVIFVSGARSDDGVERNQEDVLGEERALWQLDGLPLEFQHQSRTALGFDDTERMSEFRRSCAGKRDTSNPVCHSQRTISHSVALLSCLDQLVADPPVFQAWVEESRLVRQQVFPVLMFQAVSRDLVPASPA